MAPEGARGESCLTPMEMTCGSFDAGAQLLDGKGPGEPAPPPRRCLAVRPSWGCVGRVGKVLLGVAYVGYLVAALIIDWRRALGLVLCSLAVLLWKCRRRLLPHLPVSRPQLFTPPPALWRAAQALLLLAVFGTSGVVAVLEARHNPRRLLAVVGLVALHAVAALGSTAPRHIALRVPLWGLALQFALGLFVLRTTVGHDFFATLGDLITRCMDFSDEGAAFVFGAAFTQHYFAFKILPAIAFFSSLVAMLYHVGLLPLVIRGCAAVMGPALGVSPCEAIVAGANIFLGSTTAPLLVKPLLPHMTPSELHTLMVAGAATITGSLIGVYGAIGVPAGHLLTASVMSAPAALTMAKLLVPEDRPPTRLAHWRLDSPHRSVLEAAAQGAQESVPLIASIAAMLIAFIALVAMADAVVGWLGSLVACPGLTLARVCGVAFYPVALLMGVDLADAFQVATLLGTKTILNEFVAYTQLAALVQARALAPHSVVICSYALCGFSNLGSLGTMVAMFGLLVPDRAAETAALAPRALLGGTLACLSTACVAGLLYDPEQLPALRM